LLTRKASKEDAQEILDLRNAAISFQCSESYSECEIENWTNISLSSSFINLVADHCYVATVNSFIVATGMINLETGKLDALFVHPQYMRAGIGKHMMILLESLALQAGLKQLHLESTLNAVKFYRSLGFIGDTFSKYQTSKGLSLACLPMTKIIDNN